MLQTEVLILWLKKMPIQHSVKNAIMKIPVPFSILSSARNSFHPIHIRTRGTLTNSQKSTLYKTRSKPPPKIKPVKKRETIINIINFIVKIWSISFSLMLFWVQGDDGSLPSLISLDLQQEFGRKRLRNRVAVRGIMPD